MYLLSTTQTVGIYIWYVYYLSIVIYTLYTPIQFIQPCGLPLDFWGKWSEERDSPSHQSPYYGHLWLVYISIQPTVWWPNDFAKSLFVCNKITHLWYLMKICSQVEYDKNFFSSFILELVSFWGHLNTCLCGTKKDF